MISKAEIKSAGGIANHVTDTRRTAEYYSGESIPSAWAGGACQALALSGPVDVQTLVNQLEGRVTDATGARQLGRVQSDGSVKRREGWDFTISETKPLSIEREAFGNSDADAAIRDSNAAVFAYLEKVGGQTRIGGALVHTGKLAIATFEHVESRRGDMDVHTHAIIMNTTIYEGKAYSLSNEALFRHRAAADALKQMQEGYELARAGYAMRYDKAGHVEFDNYTPEQIRQFSKGSAEVEARLAEQGLTRVDAKWSDRNEANLETRDRKSTQETREQAGERWRAEADAAGIRPAAKSQAIAAEWNTLDPQAEARRALNDALENLTDREHVFSLADVHKETAIAAQGRSTIEAVTGEVEGAIARGEIVQDRKTGQLTTREALQSEDHAAQHLEAGRHAHEAILAPEQFEAALDRFEERKTVEGRESGRLGPTATFHLRPQQETAARLILTGDDRFSGVQGLPGTGKTTMLEFVNEAARDVGWTVAGHSNGAEQAQKMQQESGIETTTTAAHLLAAERGIDPQQPVTLAGRVKELRIMDEASQSGQRQFNRVLDSSERDGAKTVFLGDRYQHQSVEAGKAFELAQGHMPVAELGRESITRQTTDVARAVVAATLDKDYEKAIQHMEVREIKPHRAALAADASRAAERFARRQDNADVIKQIGKDYAALAPEARGRVMVVTSTNADRQAINDAIRDEMKGCGELNGGVEVTTLAKVDLLPAEARRAAAYEPGQVVEAGASYKRQGIKRGERFKIEAIDSRGNALKVRDAAGAEKIIYPADVKLRAYASEVHEFAVGDQVRFTENHTIVAVGGNASLRVRNGQRAEVLAIEAGRGTITVKSGAATIELPGADMKLDHAYAVTSHTGQGADDKVVLIHHDTESGRHGDRESLVNVTRGKEVQRFYTQDIARAERQMGAVLDKSSAHDIQPVAPEILAGVIVVMPEPAPVTPDAPQQSQVPAHPPEPNAPAAEQPAEVGPEQMAAAETHTGTAQEQEQSYTLDR